MKTSKQRLQELAGIYGQLFEKDAGDSDNVKVAIGHVDNEHDFCCVFVCLPSFFCLFSSSVCNVRRGWGVIVIDGYSIIRRM